MAKRYSDFPKYLPIIKWQKWEQLALKKLDLEVRENIQPCIEVRDSSQHSNLLLNFSDVFGQSVALIDYSDPRGRLTGNRLSEFKAFLGLAHSSNYNVIPTISPADLLAVDNLDLQVITRFGLLALRLKINGLQISASDLEIAALALGVGVRHGLNTKLVVDIGNTPHSWGAQEVSNFIRILRQLKGLGFSELLCVSGAYPASIASVTGAAEFPRHDWRLWCDLNAEAGDLRIGFGDYGVLNPAWTEETLERRGSRVAIRYTRENDWLILRADGNTSSDSIAISHLLISLFPDDFKGASYSFGDQLLADRVDPDVPEKKKKCGHYHITEAWTHHISVVVKDQY